MRVEIAPEMIGGRGEIAPEMIGDRGEIAPEAGDGVEMAPQAPMPPPPPPSLRVPNYVRDWFQP